MPDRPQFALTTILCSDLVRSTPLLQRVGDAETQRIFQQHRNVIGQLLASHGGEELKWIGRRVMVAIGHSCALNARRESTRFVGMGSRSPW